MYLFEKNKKIISALLLISIITSFSPIFSTKTHAAGVGAASVATGAGIVAAGTTIGAICLPLITVLGYTTPPWFSCDPGVRYNTLAMLSSTLGVTGGVAQKESIWDDIGYFIARLLIRQISQSIVDWINSGFQGNPSFIDDFGKFMTNSVDRVIGEFIFASDLKFLCDPFETNIRINLGLGYSPFKDKINCTLSEILQNVDGSITNAYKDFTNGNFINGGGWDSWINIMTQPQNNQVGAMVIAQADLDIRIGDIQIAKKEEMNWSGGLLSMKTCSRTTKDANGNIVSNEAYQGDAYYNPLATGSTPGDTSTTSTARYSGETYTGSTQDTCKVVTPGVWITGTGNKVLGMDLDALGVADEFNEIVGALANFVISKVMQKGMAMLKPDDLSPNDPAWRAGIAALQNQSSGDISSLISDSNYEPDVSSYIAPGSGSSPEEITNGNANNEAAIASAKEDLQNYITSVRIPEQAYYDAYNPAYALATLLETKFLGVVSCYETKLASTTLALTNAERNTASTTINTASTTASSMTSIKNTTALSLIPSQTNLATLQTISDSINAATTITALINEQTNLTNLSPSLHTAAQAVEALSAASTTISQINPNNPVADAMQTQCDAFPN